MYTISFSEKIRNENGKIFEIVYIYADTSADIPAPKPEWLTGSRCRIINERKTLILNNAREWV